ncbi:DNA cytosine methyltransferase [Mesoplasma photuris]|uniref:DNA cytosine methyltransferase n=1 Tax=Mesoplasma photuris TaxID=217731 RepID=UPI0004E264AC|nr:DNA (cytosine-5-)-methyltransferase [Mesoplasma photuris]
MIKGTSLFANVGIDEHFFKKAGIKMKVSNELLKNRADFYKHLYPDSEMINGDITNEEVFKKVVKAHKKNKCEFLIATPPCQGMSIAGRMNSFDPRNELIKYVVKFVKETLPNNILIENVPGLLKFNIMHNNKVINIKDYIVEEFSNMGYFVNFKVADASDYGTPQNRKRVIFLISKFAKWEFPDKQIKKTVRDTIGELPTLESGDVSDLKFHYAKKHNERHVLWMKNTKTGKSAINNIEFYPVKDNGQRIKGYTTTYKRMEWDKPAPTITMASGSISSQNNVHPGRQLKNGEYSDARVLTILELFRLTGLPDDWNVPIWASDNLIRQVIGESFPPLFAYAMLERIPKKNG